MRRCWQSTSSPRMQPAAGWPPVCWRRWHQTVLPHACGSLPTLSQHRWRRTPGAQQQVRGGVGSTNARPFKDSALSLTRQCAWLLSCTVHAPAHLPIYKMHLCACQHSPLYACCSQLSWLFVPTGSSQRSCLLSPLYSTNTCFLSWLLTVCCADGGALLAATILARAAQGVLRAEVLVDASRTCRDDVWQALFG